MEILTLGIGAFFRRKDLTLNHEVALFNQAKIQNFYRQSFDGDFDTWNRSIFQKKRFNIKS